jgi:hypothetical protein
MQQKLTLKFLFSFQLLNDREKEVFKFDEIIIAEMKSKLDENKFYLGGQLKMKYDDEIGLNNIIRVYEMNKKREIEYGPPCNGFEECSVRYHEKCLEIVKNMIIKYYEIIALREAESIEIGSDVYDNVIVEIVSDESVHELLPPSPP